jgi:hypothetical protein
MRKQSSKGFSSVGLFFSLSFHFTISILILFDQRRGEKKSSSAAEKCFQWEKGGRTVADVKD